MGVRSLLMHAHAFLPRSASCFPFTSTEATFSLYFGCFRQPASLKEARQAPKKEGKGGEGRVRG